MKFNYAIAPIIITVSSAFVQPQLTFAQSSVEVAKTAKGITVLINNQNSSGSGVIIQRSGNTYTVLTAAHVVNGDTDYNLITADGKRYNIDKSSIKELPGVDLAIAKFNSSENYDIAKIGDSNQSIEGTLNYIAGFPRPTAAVSDSMYTFLDGRIIANASKPLRDGYSLVYSNNTLPGMSGGAVLNEKGELIGIHGRGDTTENFNISDMNPNVIIKTGRNLGIPINLFAKLSKEVGINLKTDFKTNSAQTNSETSVSQSPTQPKADDYYLQSLEKRNQADFQGAIADLNKAIQINPNYAFAYYRRAESRQNVGDKEKAIADLRKAAELFAAQGNKGDAFRSQGSLRMLENDYPGAIAAFSKAIELNPKDRDAYNERGLTRANSGDLEGALADYNKSLSLQPSDAYAYMGRAYTYLKMRDKDRAIADVRKALKIAPNYALSYLLLGSINYNFGDPQKAIANFEKAAKLLSEQGNQAYAYASKAFAYRVSGNHFAAINAYTKSIQINPQDSQIYSLRGDVYSTVGNLSKALTDYNQAIAINPGHASAYANRAQIKFQRQDLKGAFADLSQSLRLDPSEDKAYFFRALIHIQQRNRQQALEDIGQAVKYAVSDVNGYLYKGVESALKGDKQGALNNLKQSANLAKQQGDENSYRAVMNVMQMIQGFSRN